MPDKNPEDAAKPTTAIDTVDAGVDFDGVDYPLDGPDLFAEAIRQIEARKAGRDCWGANSAGMNLRR